VSTSNPKEKRISTIWLIIILVIACCCLTTIILVVGSSLALSSKISLLPDGLFNSQSPTTPKQALTPAVMPTSTPLTLNTLSPFEETQTPDGSDNITPASTPDTTPLTGADETLLSLQSEIVPINNPIDLAERLGGKEDIPETLPDANAPYAVGDRQDFWVTNVDTNVNFQISTVLRYVGENTYIWIQDGVDFNQNDLDALGWTFDQVIVPTNRDFFGTEWNPGVDGDPHIYIVYAGGLGYSLAGYYASADEVHPDAHEFSNAHEMFLINSDNVYLWEEYIYGTLAHEYQHMIHWYTDKNEETWLNEGFSMLAELINGYDTGGFDYSYIANPDLQLTDWGTEVGTNGPYYGAAMLFTTYILDRFGEEATQAVVANEANGMESIDLVLAELGITDLLTGDVITSEDVFADWAVANFLGDGSVADGRYDYDIYPSAPIASPTTIIETCPIDSLNYNVHQYGVDYIKLNCNGEHTLTFTGDSSVSLIPTEPYSGDYFFWSNMGDESDMSLEQTFDLTDVSAPIELTFQTWYDLEEDYDYVFITASTNGEDWQILDSTSCTTENPSGNSYGCGLNGASGSWHLESVDLSPYAGEEVTIRFDYITDAAVNGVGMAIDDIRVEAIDYFTDLETDEGGWQGDGFVRIQNSLPQTYRISMITLGNEITVEQIILDQFNQATIDVNIGLDVDSIILVISGTTPYTRQTADYSISIE